MTIIPRLQYQWGNDAMMQRSDVLFAHSTFKRFIIPSNNLHWSLKKTRSMKVNSCPVLFCWYSIKATWVEPVPTLETQPNGCCGYLSMSFARLPLRSFRSQILTSRTSMIRRTSPSACACSSRLEANVFSALSTWSSNSVFRLSTSCRHINCC